MAIKNLREILQNRLPSTERVQRSGITTNPGLLATALSSVMMVVVTYILMDLS